MTAAAGPAARLPCLLLLSAATGCFRHLKLRHRPYQALPGCQVVKVESAISYSFQAEERTTGSPVGWMP